MNLLSTNNLRCRTFLFLLGGATAMLSTLGKTCEAATADFSAERLSKIWQEEFPVQSFSGQHSPVQNVGMAPPAFDAANTVPLASKTGAGVLGRSGRPHPAVARIIVPEQGATSFGSGTLIDVRGKFGMVITNWHVVRDATGTIEVVFPDGFTSKARALKVDSDWDLAALVIWRPRVKPVAISAKTPQPGDKLTICGYGQGNYRSVTGKCTQYCAPRSDFPRHMVELDVEARQGDSGGPIFNQDGEMAGVLFGAGQGTTLGSFGGRVGAFLATLAPDIGRATESLAASQEQVSVAEPAARLATLRPLQESLQDSPRQIAVASTESLTEEATKEVENEWPSETAVAPHPAGEYPEVPLAVSDAPWQPVTGRQNTFEQMKTVLAAVGLLAIMVQLLRVAR